MLPGVVVFGVPFGVVVPGCVVVLSGGVGVPGVAVPAGGVAVPAGGVAVPAGGVAVPAGGVAVPVPGPGTGAAVGGGAAPGTGAGAPGVELWPAVPDPPAGALPPEGALCATTQVPQHKTTNNSEYFIFDMSASRSRIDSSVMKNLASNLRRVWSRRSTEKMQVMPYLCGAGARCLRHSSRLKIGRERQRFISEKH